MPYKSKERAWTYFVISVIAFWFKGGLVFIGLLWAWFFIIDLPRDLKELERYKKYLKQQEHPKLKTETGNDQIIGVKLPTDEEIQQRVEAYNEEADKRLKELMIMDTYDET